MGINRGIGTETGCDTAPLFGLLIYGNTYESERSGQNLQQASHDPPKIP
jgi:hypothetical protein